ncbi:MAG: chemotaxis protein CheW [Wenzhouxiangellaceae bacterium]|nr:chemotaxis protein CheW [Wenzhouxiangellaceae bacterium]
MASSAKKSLFDLLAEFERRSVAHDVSSSSQRDRDNTWDGVVFRLGQHRLTIGITEVDEILPLPQSTPVPGARDWLLGMANVRGNLITIADLGWFLFGSRTPITARTRLILTRLQGRYLGLIVDEVFGQRHFNVQDLVADDEVDAALSGLVEQSFPQGDERWGRFRMRQLMADPSFLDASA